MIAVVGKYLSLIKFSHTIFALPFALISVILAFSDQSLWLMDSQRWLMVLWVVLAMVGARSGAMGFNRLVDRKMDSKNPRTANRPSASGAINPSSITIMIVLSFALLVFSAWMLNLLAFMLSPVAIVLVCFYSYTKRFTSYSHLFLGLAIGAAPVASWIAVTGNISLISLLLGGAVLTWIAGFDILYALQDFAFDSKAKLHSIPVRFGVEKSLWIARFLHVITVALWGWLAFEAKLNGIYMFGVLLCAGLLIVEHLLVKKDDLSKVPVAFMNMNSIISITIFSAVILDVSLIL